ncbi:MAG: glycosyltransferase family 4 protein [Flavobacteriales bacterium]|nr:glycosyltransferase family 4 protein [Flavobacteriales bacterium]
MPSKLKILYLINDLSKGGAERAIIDLCCELNQLTETEICIATLFPSNEYLEISNNLNITCIDFKGSTFKDGTHTPKYHALIDQFKPHIIHSNLFLSEYLTLEKLNPNIAFVCHGHDNMFQFKNLSFSTLFKKKLALNFYEKWTLISKKYKKHPTYFIANSPHTEDFYKASLPRDLAKNVRIIQYGFNYSSFHNKSTRKISPNQKIRIVNTGSFVKKKNQALIIDIGIKLRDLGLDFKIDLLGDGPLLKSIEGKIISNKLTTNITCHGNVSNVQDFLLKSDIYLHTATYEPFGLVFLEAMASGLPIVTLNGKGNIGLIENYFNGFFIEEQNPETFAERIKEIMTSNSLYTKMSANGIEYSARFNIKTKAQEYFDFYKEIIRDK